MQSKRLSISNEVHNAGLSIASSLVDASCQFNMGGLGGCRHYDLRTYPKEEQMFITAYLLGTVDSVTAIYLYMKSKEQK